MASSSNATTVMSGAGGDTTDIKDNGYVTHESSNTTTKPTKSTIKTSRTVKRKNNTVIQDIITSPSTLCPSSTHLLSPLDDVRYRMIDLFAGTGAFSLAFQLTNKVNVVFSNDMVEHSKFIYDTNFTHSLTLKDLNMIDITDIPPHDILTGGFPCQPFSIAGKQEGFEDERSNVFWKILRILDHHSPQCIVLENVKNLLSHDSGNTFTTIKTNLEARGYFLRYKVLNTSEITGIPQHRERIYIVGIKSPEVYDRFSLEFPKTIKRPISELLESSVADKYYYTEKSTIYPMLHEAVVRKDTVYQYRRVYVRENKSNECPTLTANMGGGGHNVPIILDDKGIRKLTPRECFNFQGFPSSYILPKLSDTNLYKLAGNAVSVPVVKLIANRLITIMDELHSR